LEVIYNVNPNCFDILGQGLRNGDLIALCNIIESIRKESQQPIQFYLKPGVVNSATYCQEFFIWLANQTDYFSLAPGNEDWPWNRVMLWDYRDIIGDLVKIPNTEPMQKKVCVFPIYDAEYNTNRNWTPELLTKILLYCNFKYPDHEKIICAKEDMSLYLDISGFTPSTDFLTNVKHLQTCEVYVGGDTGMTHLASTLDRGPQELVYYYNGRGMLHTLPFYALDGKGTIVKFWHNFEGTTFS
jgi:hypothetical protein